jgi:MipA family protein
MHNFVRLLCIVCFSAGAYSAHAQTPAEEKPKTEIGMGVAVLHFPAYRGSKEHSTLILPAPYIDYKGDFFKADRQGLRGEIFDSERVEFSISVSGSPPTKSDKIALRKGMPDLKPSIEIGPQLNLLLTSPKDKTLTLKLKLPLRQGMTIQSKPRNAGLTFSPNLNLDIADPFGLTGGNLGLLAGPIFTSTKQNDLFYTVDPLYATSSRSAYQARGGYAGTQFLVSLSRRVGDVWVGSYLRYDNLRGATFTDSPLVSTRNFVTAGVAVSYIFTKF